IRTLAMVGPVAVAAMADGCSVAVALAGPAEPARSPVAAVTGAPVALLSGCGGWVVTAARVATVLSIWQAVLVRRLVRAAVPATVVPAGSVVG
ncbi:hypothetical protein OSJ01_25220, partial [Mycobacterium ulcerans]